MMRKREATRDYLVEIWFEIEKDADGYPESKTSEALLARPTAEIDQFVLESVPFYLKNVSRGDLVKTTIVQEEDGQIFEFDDVVERGGHNTYRLLLPERQPDEPESTINELKSKGLVVEEEHGILLAVDVPPSTDQQAIDAYLLAECHAGRWEMQDGYLHTVKTHDPCSIEGGEPADSH
jgi:hypothetical protein